MKLFLKTVVLSIVLAVFSACGSSFEWFPSTNNAPIANAGPAQSVVVGAVVTLDGSASSDADGNPLIYSWAMTSKPAGSAAVLSSATAVKPTFTADVAGSYVLSLTVNDGKTSSAPATVTVTATVSTSNTPPVANAGTAQSVLVNDTVTLNGSASSDANGDPLTYSWTLTKPTGSAATLSSTTAATPTFTADLVGAYTLSLTVNDGKVSSSAATVTVTAFTSPPVANAGLDQSVIAGTTVQLDGSASSGAIQSYLWGFTSKPPGAGNVLLSSATVVNPTFTPTVTGTYVIHLQVSDRLAGSQTSTVTVQCNLGSITVTW